MQQLNKQAWAVKDRRALKSTLTVRDLVQIDETKGGCRCPVLVKEDDSKRFVS